MGLDVVQQWPELMSGFVLVGAIVIGLFSPSAVVTYIIACVAGLLFGRVWHGRKGRSKSVGFVLAAAFLLGLLFGIIEGDHRLVIVLYILAVWAGYWLSEHVLNEYGF